MMKKFFLLFSIFSVVLIFSQKKTAVEKTPITADQALMTNDSKVIASYIKSHPNDPKNSELRSRLVELIRTPNDPKAKPKVEPLTTDKLSKSVEKNKKIGNDAKGEQAAKVLQHLFNSDPNSKEAYIQIINSTKCNLVMKFSGKKFYNLDIPAKNKNYILIEKGSYTLTSDVCDAKYSAKKNITKDIILKF